MHYLFSFFRTGEYRRCAFVMLSWTVGLIFGFLYSLSAGSVFSSEMLSVSFEPLSIVGLCCSVFLPFLLPVAIPDPFRGVTVCLICFCYGLCFGFSGCMIYYIYGSAGWLMDFLLRFPQLFTAPLFLWFSIRLCMPDRNVILRELMICLGIAAVLSVVYRIFLDPFCVKLIDYFLTREGTL